MVIRKMVIYMESMECIGTCIGEASPNEVYFISKHVVKFGEYVVLKYDGKKILGMITELKRINPYIPKDIHDPEVVDRILRIEGENEEFIKGKIKLLGDIDEYEIPKVPPKPGTKIYRANKKVLEKIFGRGNIKIGVLANNPEVEVCIDAKTMVTRHLAILAITGSGKSNTVSVIVNELVKLNAMPIIFDMHSEYVDAKFIKGTNVLEPKLNPVFLSFQELKKLLNIDEKAYIQERFLRMAYKEAMENVKNKGSSLMDEMLIYLEKIADTKKDLTQSERNAVSGVISKINDFLDKYGDILDEHVPDIIKSLRQGVVNVIDLGHVDEDYADVIVSHVLRRLLYARKNREIPPAFCVLEEAHILAPAYRSTLSKYWIDRIAREGRKFGIGLCLVSQRPKSLDANSLSQANNAIIMRIVEPSDQRHVQQASERLSDDLLQHLPSLNVGEAIVLGLMIRFPALVKIDKFEGKISGSDPDVVKEWAKSMKEREKTEKELKEEIEEFYSW